MDAIPILLYVFALVAAALARAVARGRPVYRPIAWLLTFQIVTDLLALGIRELIFSSFGPWPATGWLRVVFHVDQALFVAWRVGIVALAALYFGKKKPWLVFEVHAVVELALILGYPTVRGDLLQRAYLAIELVCLCASLGFFIKWYSGREPWTPETIVTGRARCRLRSSGSSSKFLPVRLPAHLVPGCGSRY